MWNDDGISDEQLVHHVTTIEQELWNTSMTMNRKTRGSYVSIIRSSNSKPRQCHESTRLDLDESLTESENRSRRITNTAATEKKEANNPVSIHKYL